MSDQPFTDALAFNFSVRAGRPKSTLPSTPIANYNRTSSNCPSIAHEYVLARQEVPGARRYVHQNGREGDIGCEEEIANGAPIQPSPCGPSTSLVCWKLWVRLRQDAGKSKRWNQVQLGHMRHAREVWENGIDKRFFRSCHPLRCQLRRDPHGFM